MSTPEADRLHATRVSRHIEAGSLGPVFDLILRGLSPGIASAVTDAAGGDRAVAIVAGAVIEHAAGRDDKPAVAAFARLRQACRIASEADTAIGRALLTALRDSLGPTFDEASRDAWANAYVELVEGLMAARRNRIDLVA